eukprot:GILI01005053.1.p1 GENE.GILI01005053.1~~GILI01005053.1.p1  ORF type:complete len:434 (+),score=147.76 GILI01005053.1:81-1304(+)
MSFYNPVKIFLRSGFKQIASSLGERSAIVLTTPGTVKRGTLEKLEQVLHDNGAKNRIKGVYCEIPENPTVASMTDAAAKTAEFKADTIIAIGGGSVLDTAKGVASLRAPDVPLSWLSDHLRGRPEVQGKFPNSFKPAPIIAVPTTSGTGSEVTMWGTVWDEANGNKYSISHPKLYPEVAVQMAELTLTCPLELTVSTGLDALSHSMESLWNRYSNAASQAVAMRSISLVREALPLVAANPSDIRARQMMSDAAMLGGMAISSTKTAIAHSMSYPLTSEFNMPHGLACSFTLPTILEINGKKAPGQVDDIVKALGATSVGEAVAILNHLFALTKVPAYVQKYIPSAKALSEVKGELINPARATNNLVTIDHQMAIDMLLESYKNNLNIAAASLNADEKAPLRYNVRYH